MTAVRGLPVDMPRRALLLSGGIFVLSICSFMVVPLLALYLSRELHSPAGRIGIVLSVMAVANQGLQVVVGIVSDRFGSRPVLGVGVLLASLGYLGFAARPGFALQVVCACTLGLGRAAISLVGKAMLTVEAGDRRASALALRSVAVNAGAAIGPIIGGLLLGRFTVALWAAVAVHGIFWLALVRGLAGRGTEATGAERPGPGRQLRALLGNRALLGLTCASVGFWYLFTQLNFTFPLYADDRFGLGGRVGLLFAVNAILSVALQYGAITWLNRRGDGWRNLGLGSAAVAAAFLLLGTVPTAWSLLLFVVVFSLGELVIVPSLDIVTTEVARTAELGGSFGFASLGWAAGGLLGSSFGGYGYQAAKDGGHFGLFWTANFAIGLTAMLAFTLMRRRFVARVTADSGGTP